MHAGACGDGAGGAGDLDDAMGQGRLVRPAAKGVFQQPDNGNGRLRQRAHREPEAALYKQDLLFRQREFHDSYLFDVIRRRFERRGCQTYDIAQGIGRDAGHVFVNSPLGRYMDHMKGERKAEGASWPSDLIASRPEAHRHAVAK